MARRFDLSAALAGGDLVSSLDTREILLLSTEELEQNPRNFYDTECLEELRQDIARHGILEPLLVTPGEHTGRYRIIAGHRRCKAYLTLHPEGGQVPCILLEPKDALEEELMLITTNSTTRQLTDWELAQQANRLRQIFGALRSAGTELPQGVKTRTLVAEQLGVSESKLARLAAIERNLTVPGLQTRFRSGELNESTAYQISQLSERMQIQLMDWILAHPVTHITGRYVEEFLKANPEPPVPNREGKPRKQKAPELVWNPPNQMPQAGEFVFLYLENSPHVHYCFYTGGRCLVYHAEHRSVPFPGNVPWCPAPPPPDMTQEERQAYWAKYLERDPSLRKAAL